MTGCGCTSPFHPGSSQKPFANVYRGRFSKGVLHVPALQVGERTRTRRIQEKWLHPPGPRVLLPQREKEMLQFAFPPVPASLWPDAMTSFVPLLLGENCFPFFAPSIKTWHPRWGDFQPPAAAHLTCHTSQQAHSKPVSCCLHQPYVKQRVRVKEPAPFPRAQQLSHSDGFGRVGVLGNPSCRQAMQLPPWLLPSPATAHTLSNTDVG